MAHTRSGSAGDTAIPILPIVPLGSPSLRVISVQLSPPSVDLNMPLPGPPLSSAYGMRRTCHRAAYSTRGFEGSIIRSTAPVFSSRYRIRSHVCPPSLERYTPRCSLGPKMCPRAAT